MVSLGLGLSLGSAVLRGATFTIADLFANGEEGAILSSAHFTTPQATALATTGVGVGLALDSVQGAGYSGGEFTGLGPEVIDQADLGNQFVSSDADIVINETTIEFLSGVSGTATYDPALTEFVYYLFDFYVTATGGGYAVKTSAATDASGSATEQRSLAIRAAGTEVTFADGGSGFTGEFSDISVRAIPGAHFSQTNASFKPQRTASGGLNFDGIDDRLEPKLTPTLIGSMAARFNGTGASRIIAGCQYISDGRVYLGLDTGGRMAGGIGLDRTADINGGDDIRGEEFHVAVITWDRVTVKLYLDGVEIYSGDQDGDVNTDVDVLVGALQIANPTAFWIGVITNFLLIDRVLTPAEITALSNKWSN